MGNAQNLGLSKPESIVTYFLEPPPGAGGGPVIPALWEQRQE